MNKNKIKLIHDKYQFEFLNSLKKINFSIIFKIYLELKKITKKNKVLIYGNGAGQSIADHFAVDLNKVCKINTLSFQSSNYISCYANDYGFEKWICKSIEKNYRAGDKIILISASGNSKNIINAAKYCKSKKIKLITISGFKRKNKLKKMGSINLWFETDSFNVIESLQHYFLMMLVDLCKGNIFYSNKV